MKKQLFLWALNKYKAYKQSKNDNSQEHALKTVKILLDKAKYGFYISQGNDGWASTRYVQPITDWIDGELCVWVGTSASSRKVEETRNNPQVTMGFGNDPAGANLIIYGTAEISNDPVLCRKYWKPAWRLFFPEGPKSDDLVVIRIKPKRIELMDFKRNIIPEPFGLKPLVLEQGDGQWIVT